MRAYYNEHDKKAAAWLRELIAQGHIMPGDVDTRSIADVQPADLAGYDRCHFFAGIGGWDYALQLANWTGPVWTGSCPCQPFSSAGKGGGVNDERHLWPEFARLIGECKPGVVFGEQVASKAGRGWFDGVSTDLEDMGYAAAAADLCAAGAGAPHIRQRLFWVADAGGAAGERIAGGLPAAEAGINGEGVGVDGRGDIRLEHGDEVRDRLGHANAGNCDGRQQNEVRQQEARIAFNGTSFGCDGLADAEPLRAGTGDTDQQSGPTQDGGRELADGCDGLANPDSGRCQRECGAEVKAERADQAREPQPRQNNFWHDFGLVRCVEPTKEPGRFVEKRRRIESGTLPLADGISGRVGLLRGYGNAIVPQVAAEFIMAYMETR